MTLVGRFKDLGSTICKKCKYRCLIRFIYFDPVFTLAALPISNGTKLHTTVIKKH